MCEHRDIRPAHPTAKNGWAFWQRLMVLSRRTCQTQLPRTFPSCGKFSWTEFSGALCWCLSHLRWFPISHFSVDFGWPLLQPFQHFYQFCQQKGVFVHQTRELLNQNEATNIIFSSWETQIVLSPPRNGSDTRTASDNQWHESQWQQDR